MEFIIGLYLVGYFISVGIAFGFKDQKETWWQTFNFACFLGLLSWINVGIIIGDFCRMYLKKEKDEVVP